MTKFVAALKWTSHEIVRLAAEAPPEGRIVF
jgi:hypothetical protein